MPSWLRWLSKRTKRTPKFPPKKQFVYSPLDGGADFRLLRVFKAQADQPLRCKLTHHSSHGTHPEYDALSYYCGDQERSEVIEVNECAFKTTDNAYRALRTIRKPDEDIVVWVDAICIHQDDRTERGGQVQRMSRIYSQASNVLVWLGEKEKENDAVFNLLNELHVAYADRRLVRNSQIEAFEAVLGPMVTAKNRDALAEVLRRRWFRRLWVVQEVALARNVIFRCADREATWDGMTLGLQFLIVGRTHKKTTIGLSERSLNTSFQDMHKIREIVDHFRTERRIGHVHTIPSVMYRYAPFNASERADYIYGLLGLLNHSKKDKDFRLKVDYEMDPADIFASAVRRCLEVTRSWDILSVCDYYHTLADSDSNSKTPSWVPDFSKHGSGKTISFILGDMPLHQAGGTEEIEYGKHYWYEDNDSTLVVKGYLVDTVKVMSKPGVVDRDLIGWCRDVRELAQRHEMPADSTLWACLGTERPVSRFRKLAARVGQETILSHFERLFLDNPDLENHLSREGALGALKKCKKFTDIEIECAMGWMTTVTKYMRRRRFVITEHKRMALANRGVEPGDWICVLPGGKVPYIIRAVDDASKPRVFELIGDCFVKGLMRGEALEGELEQIRLV